MAVVLVVAAVVLAGLVVIVGLIAGSPALLLLGLLEPALAIVLLLLVVWLGRERLGSLARHGLVRIAGPAIVRSMPPRAVLETLLNRVFGANVNHDEIVTALLGGGGGDLEMRDMAVSRATTVRVTLTRIDDATCMSELAWSHEFAGVRDNHRLVMFATSNSDIFTLLTSRRVYPLFEAWFVQTEDELEDFEHSILDRIKVGMSYRDEDGFIHTVAPRAKQGEEVAFRDYEQFVRLPDRLDRQELVIFQLDLYDLADPDHVVEAVERLTLRASTIGAFDQGFIGWSAPSVLRRHHRVRRPQPP